MRFRKGSKVEVLSKEEVPSGAWRCAEIVWGNGHNYDVKYEWSPGATGTATTGRVSRKQIRPCPPPVRDSIDWFSGDLVEVLDDISWKTATILKVTGGSYFLVRPLGSSQELRVHKSYLRVRQSWQHDKWFIIGKGSIITEDGAPNNINQRCYEKTSCQVLETVRKAKRCDEANIGLGRKLRAVETDGRHQQMIADRPSLFLEKVDAVASPRNMLGEKYMRASFINRSGFSDMGLVRAETNDVGYFNDRGLEPNDVDSSDCCSVGSCGSTSNSPSRFSFYALTNPSQEPDGSISDAESFCGRQNEIEVSLPTEKELAAEIHRLELHAYRCTMESLYASGPLSWEQEELVTDLRLNLHISNDEHLMEIRNLVSAETCLSIS